MYNLNYIMKIEIRQIQSLKLHGASCHLLILNNLTHILLDCGIATNFDFTHYLAHKQSLEKVEIILLTHSSLEYLGALPFLIEELSIKPKIYATQPIIILGPLNIHQAMLNLNTDKYNSQVFKRIYMIFESIAAVKPLQKKYFDLNTSQHNSEKKQSNYSQSNNISMTCYQVGSTIGSICWKLSYCMFNCLYLVSYNNYQQFHIEGLDLDPIVSKKTDLVITDCYSQREKPNTIRRQTFKKEIEGYLLNYFKHQDSRKIIFSCYPNERIVEVMCILNQLFKEQFGQHKVDVIHVSSSYLQLIKSQSEFLSFRLNDEMKEQNQEEKSSSNSVFDKDFISTRKLQSKICLTSSANTKSNGLLWPELVKLNEDSLIVHVGRADFPELNQKRLEGVHKIFLTTVLKPSVAKIEQQQKQSSIIEQERIKIQQKQQQPEKKLICGKYIHDINFPRFVSRNKDPIEFDAYGQRFESVLDIGTFAEDQKQILAKRLPELKKKKISTVQNMHIDFQLPVRPANSKAKISEQNIQSQPYKTTFESSIQILRLLNPEKIVFINCTESEFKVYRSTLLENRNSRVVMEEEDEHQPQKRILEIHGIHKKGIVHLSKENQTLEQTLNLVDEQNNPIEQLMFKNLIKVDGAIMRKPNNEIVVRLVQSDDKELMDFQMSNFYKSIRNTQSCVFTENGLEVNGIKLTKRLNEIIIEGYYSMEYFRLRQLIYEYIENN